MYKVGDLIVYGSTGVCMIEDICQKQIGLSKSNYYTLRPIYKTETIYAPVDNSKVFTRYVMTREQAEELIEVIPTIDVKEYISTSVNDLKNQYDKATSTFDCHDLVELTISIYAKKKLLAKQNKKVGQIDERYMKRAEEMLFGELAIALDMPIEDVPEYIFAKVNKETAEIA